MPLSSKSAPMIDAQLQKSGTARRALREVFIGAEFQSERHSLPDSRRAIISESQRLIWPQRCISSVAERTKLEVNVQPERADECWEPRARLSAVSQFDDNTGNEE
ncbi:MAG: hypothetical protein RJA70_2722 [Pseudomonadota bacterium]